MYYIYNMYDTYVERSRIARLCLAGCKGCCGDLYSLEFDKVFKANGNICRTIQSHHDEQRCLHP